MENNIALAEQEMKALIEKYSDLEFFVSFGFKPRRPEAQEAVLPTEDAAGSAETTVVEAEVSETVPEEVVATEPEIHDRRSEA